MWNGRGVFAAQKSVAEYGDGGEVGAVCGADADSAVGDDYGVMRPERVEAASSKYFGGELGQGRER